MATSNPPHPAHGLAPALLAVSVLLVACRTGDTPTDDPFQVWDSAGIEIVESVTPEWDGDGWRISDAPPLVIGRVEGDERYLFGWINRRNGAVVLGDGRIAVLDGRATVIRVYSPEGEHIEDWGRRGEGPGEFGSYPIHVFPYRGDSILVSEETLRFSVYDDAGRFARRATAEMRLSQWYDQRAIVERGTLAVAQSCCDFLGPLPTGALLLATPEVIPNTGSGLKRSTVLAAVVPDTGGVADSIGAFDAGRWLPQGSPGGRPGGSHFQPSFNVALGDGGFLVTEGDSYSIDAHDVDGRLARIIRLAREPRPVTEAARAANEEAIRARIEGYGDPVEGGSPEDLIRQAISVPYPAQLPSFEWLQVDSEGNIWAGQRGYEADDEGDEAFVFGGDGRFLGVVAMPPGLSVFQIGTDFILGHATDDLGVHYVHRYRIEK